VPMLRTCSPPMRSISRPSVGTLPAMVSKARV
jgi:hypothetical protein